MFRIREEKVKIETKVENAGDMKTYFGRISFSTDSAQIGCSVKVIFNLWGKELEI